MERPVDKDIIHLGAATNLKHQKDAVLLLHNRGGKKSLDFCHDEVEKLNVSLQWFLVLPYLIFFFKRLNSFFKKKKKNIVQFLYYYFCLYLGHATWHAGS